MADYRKVKNLSREDAAYIAGLIDTENNSVSDSIIKCANSRPDPASPEIRPDSHFAFFEYFSKFYCQLFPKAIRGPERTLPDDQDAPAQLPQFCPDLDISLDI